MGGLVAFAFDTLGYSRRLRDAGVPQPQAEAHAEAAREFIMGELATRADLQTAIDGMRREIDTLALRLTVRLGGIVVAAVTVGIAVLALILKS